MRSLQFLLALGSSLLGAEAHGTMSFPSTRNTINSFQCPQCANGPSVCGSGTGSQWSADDTQASLLDSVYVTPLTNLVSGGMVEVEAYFTAAHMGHFVVELCANPDSVINNSCFQRLERDPTDTRYGPYVSQYPTLFFLPDNNCVTGFQSNSPLKARFKVPAGITSDHAILRWQWQTGNSCDTSDANTGRSADPSLRAWSNTINGRSCSAAMSNLWIPCGSDCPSPSCAGEHFRTCADVKIITGDPSTVVSSGNASTEPGNGNNNNGGNGGNNNNNNNNNGGNGGNDNNNNGGIGGNDNNNNNNNNNNGGNGGDDNNNNNNNGGSGVGGAGGANGVWSAAEVTACQGRVRGLYLDWDTYCKNTCAEYATDLASHGAIWCKNAGVADLTKCVTTLQAACV